MFSRLYCAIEDIFCTFILLEILFSLNLFFEREKLLTIKRVRKKKNIVAKSTKIIKQI